VGHITAQGLVFTVTQNGISCQFALTPSTTSVPFTGGTATVGVATNELCAWTASVSATAPWITIASGASGTGNGTVTLSFAANTTAQARPGTVTVGTSSVTFTQAATNLGSLTGVVTNTINLQPVEGASVTLLPVGAEVGPSTTTNAAGSYTVANVPAGNYNAVVAKQGFVTASNPVAINPGVTRTHDVRLAPLPVNLAITFNPNPTSVNSADPDCDGDPTKTGPYCWQSDILFRETNGTAAIFSSLTIHFFDSSGAPTAPGSVPGTWDPLPFTVPGGSIYPGFVKITHTSSLAKGVVIEFFGTDPFGQKISIRTPTLNLDAVPVIGLRSSDQTAGTAVVETGGGQGQSGRRPIRRQ
jgi:hypothetical protein